jgi:Tol biopolymer transport system component
MAKLDASLSVRRSQSATAPATLGCHWLISALGVLMVAGLYLISWAANHAGVGDPFVSLWAIPMYVGFVLVVVVLIATFMGNRAAGYSGWSALPQGYPLALLGSVLFLSGLLAGLFGQPIFGAPVDLEIFTSPILLLIYLGALLIVSAPVRAAWVLETSHEAPSWRSLGPALLSAGLALSTLTFMTQFAHPLTGILASQDPNAKEPVPDIYIMNADGTRQTRLTISSEQGVWGAAWSPDGSKIVFSLFNPSVGAVELYLMNADGNARTQLTHNQRFNFLPAWSPDGKTIAFISQLGSTITAEVHSINADGSNERELTENNAWEYGMSWSPDSKQIVFGSDREGSWQIYSMNADGSDQKPLPNPADGNAPAWSRDGKQIAFVSSRHGEDEIYVMDPDGSNQTRLTANAVWEDNPQWSPDGRQIVFTSRPDGADNIFVMDADGTHVRNITQSSAGEMYLAAWSPDGKTILYDTIDNPLNPPFLTQPLGIASLLLQTALLMGLLLIMVQRWTLPFGALTFIITMNAALISLISDEYVFVAGAFAAGLIAELLLRLLKPSISAPVRWYSFAFLVPFFLYGLYFLTIFRTRNVIWSPHLWLGSIVEAGLVGLLLGFLVRASAEELHKGGVPRPVL